ncbi:MAG TPA: hypothetical protein VH349_15920 [Ktedonobacterales bacterium]|jgi:hypothetical protein
MSLVDQIINWALLIGVLLTLPLAVASLWLWGGARRGALGRLMAGALLLVSGAVFLYVPQINVFARMDNAYLGNAWLGSWFMLLGVILLIGSLAGYGVHPWLTALLVVASVLFTFFGNPLLTRIAPTPDSEILLYAALLLGGVLIYITLRGYFLEALIAATLTTLGFALAWRLSGGDLRAFTPVTILDDQHFYKPPVLDFGPLFICLFVATVLFFAGRFIQGVLRSQRPPAIAEVVSPD